MYEELEFLLRRICFKVKVAGRKVLKDFDITPSQFDILQRLFFVGEMRLTDLSEALGITKGTTSGIVKRLIEYGYIKRVRSQLDKRVYNLSITEDGRKIINKVIKKRVQYIKSVFESLDEEIKNNFLNYLRKIIQVIEGENN